MTSPASTKHSVPAARKRTLPVARIRRSTFSVGYSILLLLGSAHAGPRTSANYSITTDTADAGGLRTTSANYTNDGSTGAVSGLSTVASPVEFVKSGYVGQLYDVTGLVVNAGGATTVNETATLQLAAWQLLDDTSYLAVNATSVTWSVLSGPITGISAAGLATAGTVPQNTAATVQGVFSGFAGTLNLTVLDTIPDNFGLYAGDGVDDAWQVQYFGLGTGGLGNPLGVGSADADGTGQTNLFKYIAGLNPLDGSRFVLSITGVPGQSGQKNLIFTPLVAGRTYTVKYRPDLMAGSWQTLTGTTQSDSGNQRTVTDTAATGARKFYHVEITKP